MAQRVGAFVCVRDVLAAFQRSGCEVRTLDPTVLHDDGDCTNLRYVYNPQNGQFVELVDLDDGDSVPAVEVTYWERRLGLVPKRRDRP